MAKPLQIVITTKNSRVELDDVMAVNILPHEAGVQIRQGKIGYTLVPMEQEVTKHEEHEETLPLEPQKVCGKPARLGIMQRIGAWLCLHGLLVDLDGVGGNNG